ncbi:UNVERIFIED_CONTAM: hypothetical protein FKN15_064100 [Acipenser sinensis]
MDITALTTLLQALEHRRETEERQREERYTALIERSFSLPDSLNTRGNLNSAMIALDFNLNVLTRDLSLYLEQQVKVGFFGSGVGLSLILGFSAAYTCYYLSSVVKKPQLVTGGEKFCHFLKEHCPVVSETYYPTFWCWEGRIQTLIRPFIIAKPWVEYRNEFIKTADGGQISLDWFDNDDSMCYPDRASRPTILLLPGLTGTSRESYIRHMIQQSHALGYRCVVFNNRGVSGERLLRLHTSLSASWSYITHAARAAAGLSSTAQDQDTRFGVVTCNLFRSILLPFWFRGTNMVLQSTWCYSTTPVLNQYRPGVKYTKPVQNQPDTFQVPIRFQSTTDWGSSHWSGTKQIPLGS